VGGQTASTNNNDVAKTELIHMKRNAEAHFVKRYAKTGHFPD
jgi:hypothetical protein